MANWKYFPALYLAGIVAGGIALVVTIVCLVLRLKKRNGEEHSMAKYYNILTYTSMISATVALGFPLIGTLITMFM